MHELVQRLRDRQGLARLDGDVGALQHAHDLERVERIPAGRFVDFREQRSRERRSELPLHHPSECERVERADVDAREPLSNGRPQQLIQKRALGARASRQEKADRLGPKTSHGVREAGRRRVVEPLRVVDRDQHRPLLGKQPEGAQQRDAEDARLDRRPLLVADGERARQRLPLHGRKWGQRHVEHRVEEVANAGERQRRLTLHRLRLQHEDPELLGVVDGGTPERRLPHAGLSLEHEPDGPAGDARDEVPQGGQLGVPPDDDLRHERRSYARSTGVNRPLTPRSPPPPPRPRRRARRP